MVILRTIGQLGNSSARWLFWGYAQLYLLVEQAVSRRLEYEADRASVAVAGRTAAASALRDTYVIGAAWKLYLETYLRPAEERRYLPVDLFDGFGRLYAARRDELEGEHAEAGEQTPSRWDSHPSLGQRLAAMQACPDVDVSPDERPASLLVVDQHAEIDKLTTRTFPTAGRRLLRWTELTPAVSNEVMRDNAELVFEIAARITGRPRGDLDTVLELLADDRRGELASALAPHPEDASADLAAALEDGIAAVMVAAGVAGWQHSWAGPAELVDGSGVPVPIAELVGLAADPATVPQLRHRLALLGVRADGQQGAGIADTDISGGR